MAKSSVIFLVGVSSLLTLMVIGITSGTHESGKLKDFRESKAKFIANQGLEIYLEKVKLNSDLEGDFLNNKFAGGEYDIHISSSENDLSIQSKASYNGKNYVSELSARKSKINFPKSEAVVFISAEDILFKQSGKSLIDGRDYLLNGIVKLTPTLAEIGVDEKADSIFIKDNKGSRLNSIKVVEQYLNCEALAENLIASADLKLQPGKYEDAELGSDNNPKIIYAKGDVKLSGNSFGCGIIVSDGSIELSGNSFFKGMILMNNKKAVSATIKDQASVYGAAVLDAEIVSINLEGNAKLYYSSKALSHVKDNLKTSKLDIFSWKK